MKNKYNIIYGVYTSEESYYNDSFGGYKSTINITDYIKEYSGSDWKTYDPETEEERLARIKAEKRNDKIDQILG